MSVVARLKDLSITLPALPPPAGNYVGWVRAGDLIFTSGQLPLVNGAITVSGILGVDVSLEEGYAAARTAAINLLAQLFAALDGDLDRVARVVKVTGFVASAPDFTDQPKVINGASDLIAAVFGDAGKHARAAVGCSALPLGAAVEVEAIIQVR